jgi:hypothetical protein
MTDPQRQVIIDKLLEVQENELTIQDLLVYLKATDDELLFYLIECMDFYINEYNIGE